MGPHVMMTCIMEPYQGDERAPGVAWPAANKCRAPTLARTLSRQCAASI